MWTEQIAAVREENRRMYRKILEIGRLVAAASDVMTDTELDLFRVHAELRACMDGVRETAREEAGE